MNRLLHCARATLLCWFVAGCGGGSGDSGPNAPFVPAHILTVSPTAVTLPAGATRTLVATNAGGEAIQFSTDWSVQEGATGGTLGTPVVSGTQSSVVYTAPAVMGGPFHVVAADHANPTQFSAVVVVTVTP